MMKVEELVPRPLVAKEFNVSHRTVCRWENKKVPGFDDPVEINNRIFHKRSRIEAVKRGLFQRPDAEPVSK
jgi:hypothetical protein